MFDYNKTLSFNTCILIAFYNYLTSFIKESNKKIQSNEKVKKLLNNTELKQFTPISFSSDASRKKYRLDTLTYVFYNDKFVKDKNDYALQQFIDQYSTRLPSSSDLNTPESLFSSYTHYDHIPYLITYTLTYFCNSLGIDTGISSRVDNSDYSPDNFKEDIVTVFSKHNRDLFSVFLFKTRWDAIFSHFRIRSDPSNLLETLSMGQKVHFFLDTIADHIPFIRNDPYSLPISMDMNFGHFKIKDYSNVLFKSRPFIMGADRGYRIPNAISIRTSGAFIDNNLDTYPSYINLNTTYSMIYNKKSRQNSSLKLFMSTIYSTLFKGEAIPPRIQFNKDLSDSFRKTRKDPTSFVRKYYRQLQATSTKKSNMNKDNYHNVCAETHMTFFFGKACAIVFENISNFGVVGNMGGLSTALSSILCGKMLLSCSYKFYLYHFFPYQCIQLTSPVSTSKMCSFKLAEVRYKLPSLDKSIHRNDFILDTCYAIGPLKKENKDPKGYYFLHNHTPPKTTFRKNPIIILRDNNAADNMTYMYTPPKK